jgi:hypothetical protein
MADPVGIQTAPKPWQVESVGRVGIHNGVDIQRAVIANRPAGKIPIPLQQERQVFRLSRLLTFRQAGVDTEPVLCVQSRHDAFNVEAKEY